MYFQLRTNPCNNPDHDPECTYTLDGSAMAPLIWKRSSFSLKQWNHTLGAANDKNDSIAVNGIQVVVRLSNTLILLELLAKATSLKKLLLDIQNNCYQCFIFVSL